MQILINNTVDDDAKKKNKIDIAQEFWPLPTPLGDLIIRNPLPTIPEYDDQIDENEFEMIPHQNPPNWSTTWSSRAKTRKDYTYKSRFKTIQHKTTEAQKEALKRELEIKTRRLKISENEISLLMGKNISMVQNLSGLSHELNFKQGENEKLKVEREIQIESDDDCYKEISHIFKPCFNINGQINISEPKAKGLENNN